MEKPIPLDRLFEKKIFRIPDYQRGYSWQLEQLRAFWDDLNNLKDDRSHYTGVLTLTEVGKQSIQNTSKEFWLTDDHSYRLYHVVDGQQRLTTFVIFIKVLLDFLRSLPENSGKPSDDIYITESLQLSVVEEWYLFKTNPKGGFRTYKFGYTEDNPSQDYFRYVILGESGGKAVQETFYTLNLGNAKRYFHEKIKELYEQKNAEGLSILFKTLTRRLLFNEYSIDGEFDVFVAFETMNNRGKKLSDLELLKNRLIYLSTLYDASQLDVAGIKSLRDDINDAWKEVYHQLGRNKSKPLNDDDFLRAHWITYFKYSRDTGRDYARFLLDEHFTPQKFRNTVERTVELDPVEEQHFETDSEDADEEMLTSETPESQPPSKGSKLLPVEIRNYVESLRASAGHWFNCFHPHLATDLSEQEKAALDRLNRLGMGYFRPLVMVTLKTVSEESERLKLFEQIERFIFIAFRIENMRSNYRSSEFYNLARALEHDKKTTVETVIQRLHSALAHMFNESGNLELNGFFTVLNKKFKDGTGFYGWSGLRYFLFEYELKLLFGSRQRRVHWDDLLKTGNDRISVEHIYPQTPTDEWENAFKDIPIEQRTMYAGSLGNLLLLSRSINASLQNDSFKNKKEAKYDNTGNKIRNGYKDGSHSEREVADNTDWGPEQIRIRGRALLEFMQKRWDFSISDSDRDKLLFLDVDTKTEN